MRAVVQRVDGASVVVDGETVGAIEGEGLCVLVGVTHEDTKEKAAQLARKLWSIRMLKDEKSCSDVGAPLYPGPADSPVAVYVSLGQAF